MVQEKLSFDAHGERRDASDWQGPPATTPTTTTHGFTNHEHIDGANLIHMNGRVFDPKLGRFVQADPIIQAPDNAQSWNRYSYVFNNPLSLTDPTGYTAQQNIRMGMSLIFSLMTAGIAAPLSGFAAFAVTVTGGALAGAVASGSGAEGMLWGALSSAAFFGIGSYFENASWAQAAKGSEGVMGTSLNTAGYSAKVLAHATTGGVMSKLQGGKFGHGFASAGVTQAASGGIDRIDGSNPGVSFQRVMVAAMLGGTVSKLTGGKFANGAITGAFSRAFNDEVHQLYGNVNNPTLDPDHALSFDEFLTENERGQISWPSKHGKVTSGFGPRNVPGGSRNHNGTDVRARIGDPIYSTQDGTILSISTASNGRGEMFVRNNDGSLSGYAHVGALTGLTAGESVSSGQQIGISNGSGIVKGQGAHLHYTYRQGSVLSPASTSTSVVDPMMFQLQSVRRPPDEAK